jgi:excinuclease ABC subunit C
LESKKGQFENKMSETDNPFSTGVKVIKETLSTLTDSAGVYRMLDENKKVLYVGKAKNLKNRVVNYTRINNLTIRIQRMVAQTRSMEIITTQTEAEALLLESDLIKKLKPKYNILLRDDKSFPHILIAENHDFPKIVKHRGKHNIKGQYFGPFASVGAVNQSLTLLQKIFLLRSCSDSEFKNRQRPCLLYQIKRCSAPCVGKIDKDDYAKLVLDAKDFLKGKSSKIQQELAKKMENASQNLEYEKAAGFRDRIRALTTIQSHQNISLKSLADCDAIACVKNEGIACVQVFFFRSGKNCGNHAFFPKTHIDDNEEQILEAFIGQFYSNKTPAKNVLLSHKIENIDVLQSALSNRYEFSLKINIPQKGEQAEFVNHVLENAQNSIKTKLMENSTISKNLEELKNTFSLPKLPMRIEVYDNSHFQGTNAVGAMIVATNNGLDKKSYRKFNIKNPDITQDDFAMMGEVLTRRFSHSVDDEHFAQKLPDIVLIDGGKGQVKYVKEVFEKLNISDVKIIGIAKGRDRNAGNEVFHTDDGRVININKKSPLMYYLQRIRDEAHRFAIGTHRAKRNKENFKSPLDEIKNIGNKRKKALLNHFGSAKAVKEAKLSELENVEGISKNIAKSIYYHFNSGN